jgi:dTDP-4-dehydrorhamnose 3,5-epimerase-like enzyme
MEIIETPIEGLKIKFNKIIGDTRGYLAEIAPSGVNNDFIQGKIGNVYLATGTEKGVPRGGHYHHDLIENFYTISGTTLWLFKDFRKESATYKKTYAIILGEKDENLNVDYIDEYLLPGTMAQILVPTEVYHVFYPLTDKEVKVLAITNLPHNNDDYVRFKPEDDQDLKKLKEEKLRIIKNP